VQGIGTGHVLHQASRHKVPSRTMVCRRLPTASALACSRLALTSGDADVRD
jgi:hypothetical protein